MTSWISVPRQRTVAREKVVTFQVPDSGLCETLNQYLYSVLYANSKGTKLTVSDTPSLMASNYPLIRSLFQQPSSVQFSDNPIPATMSIHSNRNEMSLALAGSKADTLRSTAKSLFQRKADLDRQLDALIQAADLPPSFDVAVHIRGGDWRRQGMQVPVQIDDYIKAVRTFQQRVTKVEQSTDSKDSSSSNPAQTATATSSLKPLTVFVFSDEAALVKQFRDKADKTWLIYTLPQITERTGYYHADFLRLPRKTKQEMLLQFLAELKIAQVTPALVCTLGSNVGKFLYLTAASVTHFKSIDTPYFTPY